MQENRRVAIVKCGKFTSGGLSSVSWFVYNLLSLNDRYSVDLFSLETSFKSSINTRLLAPGQWLRENQIEDYLWRDIPVKHVGANFSEFEFQRYRPRRLLTEFLEKYDLIQVIAGTPAAAYVARYVDKPVTLFVATLAQLERKTLLRNASLPRKLYGHIMLPIVSEMERRALQLVKHVFAETEYTKQAILPYIEASKISIDTIGVNVEQFQPAPEGQRAEDYILSVGRFADTRKNVILLFEAYALLRQRMSNAPKLVLAGKSSPHPAAWAVAKARGITDYVVVREDVSFSDLVTLYQNAAMFVLPSNEEGLGIVLLEAMACATPVISTRCGGPNSVVTDDIGFLVPVGDTEAMAERMRCMLQNPIARRQMGRAGRNMVEKRFSTRIVGQKYLHVYDRLLGDCAQLW